jgi:hypothetical protein
MLFIFLIIATPPCCILSALKYYTIIPNFRLHKVKYKHRAKHVP